VFDRTAVSFDDSDHVSIVNDYRWRLSLAKSDPRYDNLEKRLADGPIIAVPMITLDGRAMQFCHGDLSLPCRA
jgi:hypothetical protein